MTMGGPEISGRGESQRSGLRIFLYVLLALGGLGVLTCGGLLFCVAADQAEPALAALRRAGDEHAAEIGRITPAAADGAVFEVGS